MVAVALVGGALSAGASIFGAQEGAQAQESAADKANATQENMFNVEQQNLQPYNAQGVAANNALSAELPSLTAPINMNETTLQQTPGYQFNLTQGLKAVQNSAAARGLGISGAALKGAANYATGLADSTYQNQFNNAQTNRRTAYNMLSGQQQLGESAAAGVGSGAIATGQGVAQTTVGAGTAQGAADVTSGNAVGGAANSGVQTYLLSNLLAGGGANGMGTSGYFSGAVA
jgi:hypothetical protein